MRSRENKQQKGSAFLATSTFLHPPFAGVSGSFGDLHATLDSGGADLGELEAEERPVSSTIAAGGERSVVGNVSDTVLYPSGTSHDAGSAIEVAFQRFRKHIRQLERENVSNVGINAAYDARKLLKPCELSLGRTSCGSSQSRLGCRGLQGRNRRSGEAS